VDDLVALERPAEPMHCFRPAAVIGAAAAFVGGFAGDVLYAVKCNPDPAVLHALWEGGVRHFDCASLAEVALVSRVLPEGNIHFMHPVKARPAIAAAYAAHGVRDFVLDSADELAKFCRRQVGHAILGWSCGSPCRRDRRVTICRENSGPGRRRRWRFCGRRGRMRRGWA
jgi:diaminopimelate decarboxylase